MKLLLCAKQWETQLVFPASHSLGEGSTSTHKEEVVMAVRTVKRGWGHMIGRSLPGHHWVGVKKDS